MMVLLDPQYRFSSWIVGKSCRCYGLGRTWSCFGLCMGGLQFARVRLQFHRDIIRGPGNFDSSQPFMRRGMIWFGKWSGGIGNPTVKEEPLSRQLLRLKAKTSWSWERMCRELHRVMGEEGPSHTTLFRYASGRVRRPNVVTEQYVRKAIQKVTAELSQK